MLELLQTEFGVSILSAVGAVVGSLIGILFTHLLYKRKLNKEQKVRSRGVIGEKISKALLAVKELECKSKTYEILNVENYTAKELAEEDFFDGSNKVSAVVYTVGAISEFHDEVVKIRGKYEMFLDYKTAALVYYIDRYFSELITFSLSIDPTKIPELGAAITPDILLWQETIDKNVTKQINKPKYKISDFTSKKWEKAKKDVLENLWERSILYNIKRDENSEISKTIMAFINGNTETLLQMIGRKG